jgi:hypothetical protein
MSRRDFLKSTAATGVAAFMAPRSVQAMGASADLDASFLEPPDSARPWVLWHWMNGHVTKEGITLDLEAMKRVGLGGVINFDAGTGIPKGPVQYLSPEWFELKEHAIREAARLELELVIHNCPGWSSSGGPWITPELAMQQLTWSETHVEGGGSVELALPTPFRKLDHYRDVAAIAYPSLRGEVPLGRLVRSASSSGGPVAIEALNTSDLRAVVARPGPGGGPVWLLLELSEPCEVGSISFLTAAARDSAGTGSPGGFGSRAPTILEASDDGARFRRLAEIAVESRDDVTFAAADFPPVTTRYLRLSTATPTSYSQMRLAASPRLEDWRKRSNAQYNGRGLRAISDPGTDVIPLDRVIDVSEHVDAGGILRWQAPAGRWTVLRLGHTPLGTLNRSAPDTGIGLECDKYRAEAVAFHFDKMMQPLLPILAPLTSRGRMGLEVDSWEVGMQNWTPGFEKDFQARNGYGLLQYLPAMTGRVVGSVDTTERFLWDLRRTQADLLADRYYGKLAELCHRHGMKLFVEPYDRGPMDEMQIGARADVNMGEFWQGLSSIFQNNLTMRRTPKLAASIAHVNGQRVVGAEAFTGEPESARWQEHPFSMKAKGDEIFTRGVNRMVIHRYAHQPHPTASPGMTMGPWGIHFERTTTWWEPGRAWLRYLARCQSLLQQGLFVADLAYFTGEDAGVYTQVHRDELHPAPPEGYDYDLVDAEVLLRKAGVERGRLTLPDGMSYRVLVLQQHRTLSLALMRKLHALVREGLVLVGAPPEATPGLRDHPGGDQELARLREALWGGTGDGRPISRAVGEGRVFWGQPLSAVLDQLGTPPDVEVSSRSGDAPITWIHRAIDGADLYFLANQRRTHERLVCTFRAGGRQPELWDPARGTIAAAAVHECDASRVRVPLDLGPFGSVFVMLRSPAPAETPAALARDGELVLAARPFARVERTLHAGLVNNFAVSLWAKPESNVMLSTDNFMEGVADPWTDQYAIYPPSGTDLYGPGHRTSGLAIGRNGVAVWERSSGKPVFALAAPARLSGWTHVALVYRDGIPAVYVGGALVGKGERKVGDVHPGVGPAELSDGASYYNGDMTEPVVHVSALNDAEVRALAESFRGGPGSWNAIVEPVGAGVGAGLRIWRNGTYRLTTNSSRSSRIVVADLPDPIAVTGPWRVSFPAESGAPESIELGELASLHRHPLEGVRYFSGTATYRKELTLPLDATAGRQLFLDLGDVEVMAEVLLNGTSLAVLWTRPFLVDLTPAVRAGSNLLEIRVTNLWPNRLIGDEQAPDEDTFRPGAGRSGFASLSGGAIQALPPWYVQGRPKPRTPRIAFTTWKHYTRDSPLLESGLIGPVVLRAAVTKRL